MNLVEAVVSTLAEHRVLCALVGAGALATYGVSRSTHDVDLFVMDPRCLNEDFWEPLEANGAEVEVRRGDWQDPLAGVVRIAASGERPVDIIVGKFTWQRTALERAQKNHRSATSPAALTRADWILFKLFAGGPQDAWDIRQLLGSSPDRDLRGEVTDRLGDLPDAAARLWLDITGPMG